MGYYDYLWKMLQPLGVYSGDGYSGGELKALGTGLDQAQNTLDDHFREMLVCKAEHEGLLMAEQLFPMLAAEDTAKRRAALETLYQTDNLCCSKAALIQTLTACGIPVTISETDTKNQIMVSLTNKLVIEQHPVFQIWLLEQILPCHLVVTLILKYLNVNTGESINERISLSLARKRTQAQWESRLGSYI